MKKYRAVLPIALILLVVIACYKLVSDTGNVGREYENYLTAARKAADVGITKTMLENYRAALEIQGSADIYAEVAEYYKTKGTAREYLNWCEEFFERYPQEPQAYDCLLNAYRSDEDYKSCFDVLRTAEKRGVSSDYIRQTQEDLWYVFELEFNKYADVGIYSNNYCAVSNKGLWGFVDRYGKQRVTCMYEEVGAYTQTNYVSVVDSEGNAYFIDKSGEKILAAKDQYRRFGLLVNGIIAAQRTDGKYTYMNDSFDVLFGAYDYASTINGDIAAVRTGDRWSLINAQGETAIEGSYRDVKLDEKQIAYRNDRLFVSVDPGKFIMIDGNGAQVGSLVFEDTRVFSGTEPAAVKIDGRWCFIDADGALISDRTYDDARSFANGLAAVCIDGLWGFVDLEENIVIEPQFFGAKDFNEKGSCFVKTGDDWQLLKLYRLNRED